MKEEAGGSESEGDLERHAADFEDRERGQEPRNVSSLQKLGKARKQSSLSLLKEHSPAHTLI